jgi:hypothetical protein
MLLPDVNGVRLATLDDLPRIAIVATAAFFWSPTFRFQRPYYQEFPADTLASYWSEYKQAMEDPACVVLITEDVLEADEAEHIYKALRSACPLSRLGQKAIVGVCSITLKPGSCYVGHFQPAGKHVSAALSTRDGPLKLLKAVKALSIESTTTIVWREIDVLRPPRSMSQLRALPNLSTHAMVIPGEELTIRNQISCR